MPRHCKHRRCRRLEGLRIFKPAGIPMRELPVYRIGIDEFEAMRLCDEEGLSQIDAAARMAVSRGTVQRLLEQGRRTLLRALRENAALEIADHRVEPEERAVRFEQLAAERANALGNGE